MSGKAKNSSPTVVQSLKIGWVCFWIGLATLLVFLPVVITARLDPSQKKTQFFVRIWYGIILWAARVKTASVGLEKIRKDCSYVIVSNHQSHFDILALVSQLPMIVRFIAKKELRKIPLFGYAVSLTHCIFVDRSDSAKAVRTLQEGIRKLPSGISMLFFAEGTRSRDGKIGPFKKGGFRTAEITGWPILPVVVHGSRKVLPPGTLLVTPGTIEVEVLDPVPEEEVRSRPWEEIMEEVRERVVRHFERA
jgi:1-acyl-sn-glycerol-3-phosphate acyltransferase